jgi:hypothetical protein
MIFKNSQDDIIIDIPKQYTKIGIKASGGLDSTILSYMLALYKRDERPDIDIIPVTLIESTKPFQFMYTSMSLQKIKEMVGITFGTHYFKMAHTHLICEGQNELLMKLYDKEILDCHFIGITLNPPVHAFPNQSGADPDRVKLPAGEKYLVEETNNAGRNVNYQPFVNIDKRGIYELYTSLNVLDDLFPLTHSCEMTHGEYLMQTDLSKHCGQDDCWWCQERLWGFGRVD